MPSRNFLTAALGYAFDLISGRNRKAETNLIRQVGRAQAARVVKEVTGKRLKSLAGEVRSKPLGQTEKPGPGEDGDVILVSGSSNVHSFGYWNKERKLQVRFLGGDSQSRSGPGPMYDYFNVPKSVFEKFKAAGSKGGAVWDELRIRQTAFGHKFDYALSGAGAGGYVPRKGTEVGLNPREIQQVGKTYKSSKPGTGRFRRPE